jgi:hypothetical protein
MLAARPVAIHSVIMSILFEHSGHNDAQNLKDVEQTEVFLSNDTLA